MNSIVGHCFQKKTLCENAEVKTWLLCGKRGIGKASLSRAYAKHITCSNDLSAHPDVTIIESDTAPIGIDKVRGMKHFLHMSTVSAERKVVIFDSVDGLSDNTMNSMLKILEEPPKHSLIFLISHNLHGVPIVIRSRCVILRFSELTDEETRQVVGVNYPHMDLELEQNAKLLYPGVPGMVTEDIAKEISLYDNFMDLINGKGTNYNIEDIVSTDLPMHKVESLALKAIHRTVLSTLQLYKSNTNSKCAANVRSMLDRYSKVQEIFSTSKKLQVHKEATIFRIVGVISQLMTS